MWRTLNSLHGLVEADLARALDGLSLVEYTVLDALAEQQERHLRMHEVARVQNQHPEGRQSWVSQ